MLCGRYNAGCFNLDALPGINVYSDQRFSPETDIHSNKMTSPQMPRRESLASISQRRLQAVKSKSIYVLPNAFTAAALFAAYYGIIQAMNGHFSEAAIAVFFSMLFDGMDGRVARLTHTQSEFGVQMDSLADAVSFGIAPALIVYEFALVEMGKIGWAVSFVYALCALLRLARFNCNVGVVSKNYFQGLPSPAAAALVCGFVWLAVENRLPDWLLPHQGTIAAVVTLYAGLTMVSNAPFFSGKSYAVVRTIPFWVIIVCAARRFLSSFFSVSTHFRVSFMNSGVGGAVVRIRFRLTLPPSRQPLTLKQKTNPAQPAAALRKSSDFSQLRASFRAVA